MKFTPDKRACRSPKVHAIINEAIAFFESYARIPIAAAGKQH